MRPISLLSQSLSGQTYCKIHNQLLLDFTTFVQRTPPQRTSTPQESHINKKTKNLIFPVTEFIERINNQLRSPRTCTRWPRLDRRHSQINDAAPSPSKRSETSCTSARRTYGSRSSGKAAWPCFTPDISVHSR